MQDAQDADSPANDPVYHNVRSAIDNQLAGAFDATRTAHFREAGQFPNLRTNTVVHRDSGAWIIGLDVIENSGTVLNGK